MRRATDDEQLAALEAYARKRGAAHGITFYSDRIPTLEQRRRIAALGEALHRDREQALSKLFTQRPGWHHGLPSHRVARDERQRRIAWRIVALGLVLLVEMLLREHALLGLWPF